MDLRLAFRQWRRNPGFAGLAVFVLALGIGANTALFSVVHAVLLRPLAYRNPDKIVALSTRWQDNPTAAGWVSGPDFADIRERCSALVAVSAYGGGEGGAITPQGPTYAEIRSVTRGFDKVFGIAPQAGRWFQPDEEVDGGPPVVVVSDSFARRAFGNRALGMPVKISERSAIVVGVMPPGFRFPDKTDVWTPAGSTPERQNRSGHNWQVVARVADDATLEQAHAQVDTVGEALARQFPDDNRRKRLAITPLQERLTGDVKPMLWMMFGAVALILLIACANVANLLLTRAGSRSREFAVRVALGAGRGRIVRQLLAESLLLGLAGGVAAVGIAFGALKALSVLAPANLPRLDEVRLDTTTLIFTAGISLLATVLVGLIPAWRASRNDLNEVLKQAGGRGSTAGRLPKVLVAGEVALATMLAIGAGLLVRSFAELLNSRLGYRTEKILLTDARVMYSGEPSGARKNIRLYGDMLDELRRVPGVESAGGIFGYPGLPLHSNGTYLIGGGELDFRRADRKHHALFTVVTPGYFATMGIPLIEGRDVSEHDQPEGALVAVINRALARQAFPDRPAIGQQIACGLDFLKWMTIVGVVEDTRTMGPASKQQPEIYMPAMQHPMPGQRMTLAARSTVEPAALHASIRQIVGRRSPETPVKFTTMEAHLSENVAPPRFRTTLLTAMAALAVILAMAGVYGVMAYAVSRRTAEFGVRMAMGASRGDIIRMVLSQGAMLALLGLSIGIAGALAAAEVMETMVFGVTTRDFATYAVVAALVAVTAFAANLAPAWRAGRVDPMVALREE